MQWEKEMFAHRKNGVGGRGGRGVKGNTMKVVKGR